MKLNMKFAGVICLLMSILCWVAEKTFFGYVNADGVVQDSFFLPLGYGLAALGMLLFCVGLLRNRVGR